MTLDQGLAFAIVAAMMALFVWGRIRYDLVAMLGLLAAIAVGIVPFDQAFTGFSDDIVIIVGSALLVSAAVARSGVAERLIAPLAPYLTTTRAQVVVLTGAVALLSAFVKNVGALAIFMPIAFQLARRAGTSPSRLLMPMAFGALLGGIVTLIGTSPNVIVSRMRAELLGEPFRMFDFAPVGAGIALAGLVFLAFGHRLLPERKGAASIDAAFNIEGYTTEALLPEGSSAAGKTVAELEALSEGDVTVTSIIRERFRRYTPAADWTLYPDDALLLQGEPAALERLVARAGLQLVTEDKEPDAEAEADDVGVMEAVVTADSDLVDRSPTQLSLRGRYQINLLAVSRSGERIVQRLRFIRFRPGDVIALQGNLKTLPDTLGELRLLPLAARSMPLGRSRRGFLAVAVLVLAMALVTAGIVPVQIGFFGAATFILLLRLIPLREAYEVVEWPILILLGALIPVSEAVRSTGGTELIAGWLSVAADALPPMGALALILVAAMAVTPFLNNAATVLVMAPIAASFAGKLSLNPDPFLMAVAIGAACDFLTPIGHQCNTLVMGPGGYRFGDYARLGLPLSLLVIVLGTALTALCLAAQGGIAPPRLLRAETLPFTPLIHRDETMAQAAHAPASRRTRQEWLAWEEAQPERYELLWDEPTLMAGGTVRHSSITLNIAALLRERLRGGPCRVQADVKVGLPDGRWVYPDVFVRCTPRGGTETLIDDPVLVVEVLSPGTLIYNTSEKRWAYQGLPSLRHLLVVAQDQAKVEVASRDPDGTWRSVFHIGLDAELHLAAFDITLPLAGIYEDIEFPAAASADSAQSEAPNESSTTAAKA